jgi:hypothetical protein
LPLEVVSGLTANLLGNANVTLSTYLDLTNSIAPPTGTPLASASFTAIGSHHFTTMLPAVVRKNDVWQLSSCSLKRIFMVKGAQYRR